MIISLGPFSCALILVKGFWGEYACEGRLLLLCESPYVCWSTRANGLYKALRVQRYGRRIAKYPIGALRIALSQDFWVVSYCFVGCYKTYITPPVLMGNLERIVLGTFWRWCHPSVVNLLPGGFLLSIEILFNLAFPTQLLREGDVEWE